MTLRQDPSQSLGGRGTETRWGRDERVGTLSVIVPSKNESAGLPQLLEEIDRALRGLREDPKSGLVDFEVLIVDDGSTDATAEVLDRLERVYPELRSLRLADNVGQTAAIAAGFREARGDWVGLLDADLQNDPADLATLWKALPGYDAVLGWRVKREDVWSKRLISRWANRIRNRVLKQDIKDTGCSLRIFPRAVALRLPLFQGAHRFFGPLLIREGCEIAQVPVSHRPRAHGISHYNIWNRSFKVAVDLLGMAWLSRRPLRYRILSKRQAETPHGGWASARAASRVSARVEAEGEGANS